MTKPLDPVIAEVLKRYSLDPKDALWNCHGVLCMYHRTIERVAAQAGITFEKPAILENDGANKSVAICVTGTLADKTEWSIGEANPANCKNAYFWAMAEKRGKDRVVLKLIGLHGLVYSEDEIDEPAPAATQPTTSLLPPEMRAPPADNASLDSTALGSDLIKEIRNLHSLNALDRWAAANKERIGGLREPDKERVRGEYAKQKSALTQSEGMAA